MYVKDTVERYVLSVIPDGEIYHFDNGNGKVGFRIDTYDKISRKQIEDIEKKTDLFLVSIDLSPQIPDETQKIELEFLRI
jgi:hypothetical protein